MATKPGFSCYMPSRKGIYPSYNVVHRLRMREIRGSLHPTKTSYPVCRSLFGKVPERLGIPLKDIVDTAVLHEEGHVFLGFSKDGQFVLSYTLNVEADDHTAFPIYVYRLHWWKFNNAQPMDRVSEVRLFGDEEIQQDLYIAVCSWPTDQSKVMVYGCCARNTYDFDEEKLQCYLTITAIPSILPCQQCLFHKYSNQDQFDFDPAWNAMFADIIPSPPTPPKCLQHGFAVHTKYELSPPYPSLSPKHSLAKDGLVVLNTGDALIALSVKLGEFGTGSSFYSPLVSGSASLSSYSSKHSSIRGDSQTFSNSPGNIRMKILTSPQVKGQEPGNSQELLKESSDLRDAGTQTSPGAEDDIEFKYDAVSLDDCSYKHQEDVKRTRISAKCSKLCFSGLRCPITVCHCSTNPLEESTSLDSSQTDDGNSLQEDSHFAWIDNLEDEGSPRNTCAHSHPAEETCASHVPLDIPPSNSSDVHRTCKVFNKVDFSKARLDKACNTPDEFYRERTPPICYNHPYQHINKCPSKETEPKMLKLKPVLSTAKSIDTCLCDGLNNQCDLNKSKDKFHSESQNYNEKYEDDKLPLASSAMYTKTSNQTNAFFHEDVRLPSNLHQPLLGDYNLSIGSEIRHQCPVHNMVETIPSSQMTIRECTCQLQGFTYSVRRFVERTPGEELLGPLDLEAYDYHSMLPLSVLGDRQAPMILTNRTARSEGACIDVKQLTMDAEHYICDAIRMHATWGHRFIAFTDYDMQILDVCPDSCSVLVMIMALIRARPVPKQPQNVFEFVDEPFSEFPCLYQTGFKFAWNLRTGRCKTIDIEDLQEFDQAKLKKTWNPGRALCQRIQRQWSIPQSHAKGVHVLTNEAVFKNRSLTKLIDPVHYMAIVLT
ncbi:DDB1- and CUL4-associated factor 15-like [Anneissia japonica]|uniref:DDB1- and CUL4-associated factor 15-like n=1 Tax=Anneissia japonica TaxID=1529436 RepID=UPI00142593B4|nr:DDB1- and CUL4-associated factor 15-like [Anneissia japonica]